MYAQGYDFSYLYPFSTVYDRKFGYECCVCTLDTSVNLSLMHKRNAVGFYRLAEAAHPLTEEIRFLDGLLELLRSLAADHSYAKFTLPFEPSIASQLPEWFMGPWK